MKERVAEVHGTNVEYVRKRERKLQAKGDDLSIMQAMSVAEECLSVLPDLLVDYEPKEESDTVSKVGEMPEPDSGKRSTRKR